MCVSVTMHDCLWVQTVVLQAWPTTLSRKFPSLLGATIRRRLTFFSIGQNKTHSTLLPRRATTHLAGRWSTPAAPTHDATHVPPPASAPALKSKSPTNVIPLARPHHRPPSKSRKKQRPNANLNFVKKRHEHTQDAEKAVSDPSGRCAGHCSVALRVREVEVINRGGGIARKSSSGGG